MRSSRYVKGKESEDGTGGLRVPGLFATLQASTGFTKSQDLLQTRDMARTVLLLE